MNQMYLTLPSNSSMSFFPENRLNNFSTRLQSQLHLGEVGAWEVGLSEIHYPRNWLNVSDPLFKQQISRQDDWCISLCQDKASPAKTNHWLQPGHYDKVSDVCAVYGKRLRQFVEVVWDVMMSRVKFKVKKNHKVTLSKALANMMGLPEVMMAGKDQDVVYKGDRVTNKVPDIKSLYVYCDLVNHQFVGDTRVPLLRIVPAKGKHGDYITHIYENIQYLPTKGGSVQTVEVDIRDDTGKPIPFEPGRVIVTLHLRRAQSPYFQA